MTYSFALFSDEPHPDEEILSEGENDFDEDDDYDYEEPDPTEYMVSRETK